MIKGTILILPLIEQNSPNNTDTSGQIGFAWYSTFSIQPVYTIRAKDSEGANKILKDIGIELDVNEIPSVVYKGSVYSNLDSFISTLQQDANEKVLESLFEMLKKQEVVLEDGTRITTNFEIIQKMGGSASATPKYSYDLEGVQKLLVWNIENKKYISVGQEVMSQ